MTVSPINQNQLYPTVPVSTDVKAEDNLSQPQIATANEVPVENDTRVDAESENGRGKGVLRLLQEGHFKGVADVRLRINFHEEIAAMDAEKATQVAHDGISDLSGLINDEIDGYLQTLPEDQIAAMSEAHQALSSEISSLADQTGLSSSELTSQLQAAFDNFVAAIKPVEEAPAESEIVAPEEQTVPDAIKSLATTEEPVEQPADSETEETESGLSLEDFISALTVTFSERLAELQQTLDTVSVLPPLSEPSGKGTAYQKFVDIYNSMQGTTGTENEQALVDETA